MTLKKGCFVLRECLDLRYVSSILSIKMSRLSFTTAFKLSVCLSAEEFGNREAGRRFSMDESVIRCWRTSKATIGKKALSRKSAKWPQLEERLVARIREKSVEGYAISTLAHRLKARSLAEDDIGDFTASPSQAYRFMACHQLSVRHCTHISQHLPNNMAKTMHFQS